MGALPGWVASAWLVLVGVACAGCSNPTQITLLIASDQCSGGATATSITVGDPPNIENNAPSASTTKCATDTGSIGSLVLVPSGADDAPVEIRVVLGTGDAGADPMTCLASAPAYAPGCIVARRIVSYVPHQNVIVPIEMLGSCDTTTGRTCAAAATCVSGACIPAAIPDPTACTSDTACMLTGPAADGGVDAPSLDAPISDTSVTADVTVDSTAPFDGGACTPAVGCYIIPANWTLAGLDQTNTGSCPAAFEGSMVIADPTSACMYGPCSAQPPACSGSGSFNIGFVSCNLGGPFPWSGTGCQGLSITLGSGSRVQFTPTPSSTMCALPAATPMIGANAQACTNPNSSICDGGTCHQAFSSPFKACIEQSGAQTCPPSSPFTVPHVVATSANSNCPAATCTVTASCNGTVEVFGGQCNQGGGEQVVANGACNQLPQDTNYFQFTPGSQTTSSCTPNPTPEAGAPTLMGQRTFCCVP